MKIVILACVLIFILNGSAFSDIIFSDTKMDSLVQEADAFIVSEKIIFKIFSDDDARLNVGIRIQINSKKGEKYGRVVLSESEFVELNDVEARITNLSGKIIKELDDDDIEESTISPGQILYEKSKRYSFHLKHNKYPYIMEIEYEYDYSSLFFWPNWHPQSNIPVRYAEYKLIREAHVEFNSFTIGKMVEPIKSVDGDYSVDVWILKNIPKRKDEDFMPPENEIQQALLFSAKNFILGESEGNFETWDTFAEWYRRLIKNKFNLSPEAKRKIEELIKDEQDPYKVISILYKFLQGYTRYVAIYLDIGGWEPHSAQTVFDKKYGDCKDLTVLMIAMLDCAGIKAYPALMLTRGEGVVYPEFISNQFNHVLAFIPLGKDSVWLECTADFTDVKELSSSREDVNVLVIKDDRGEIIRTPQAPMEKNRWISTSKMEYLYQGMLSVKSNVKTSGKKKRIFKDLFIYVKPTEEKIILQKIFGYHLPNLTLEKYSYSEEDDKSYSVDINGLYRKAIAKTRKRLFINPNIFNRKTKKNLPDEEIEDREFPIHFSYPYQNVDTVYIKLPSEYSLESAPEPVSIDLPFAHYKTEYVFEDRQLKYVRNFAYKKNNFSVEEYHEFYTFLEKVIKNDNSTFVFKK